MEAIKSYTLCKIFSIWKSGNLLCMGAPAIKKYIELPNNSKNFNLIKKLINDGITFIEIQNEEIYDRLYRLGMLEDKNIDTKRKFNFYDYLSINIDLSILKTPIIVFGAGAGGSSLIYLLAQFGFDNITVFDNDIVEESDLEKTMVYRYSNIGEYKVEALKKIVHQNFNINLRVFKENIENYANLRRVIESTNSKFIIKACDPSLKFRLHLNEICFKKNIPFLHIAYSYNYIILGPLFIPGVTCCDNSTNLNYKKQFGENHDFKKHKKLFSKHTQHPSISFNINTLSNLALNEIIMYLSNNHQYCKSIGKHLLFDVFNFKAHVNELICNNECKFSKKISERC
jgi:hypothetical protein